MTQEETYVGILGTQDGEIYINYFVRKDGDKAFKKWCLQYSTKWYRLINIRTGRLEIGEWEMSKKKDDKETI